ncbi:MAG TPA: hypothetical protein VGX94_06215, partial [Terriglobia bacterium]|nr:hypothetical protein [Terriglobia bacterium]
EVSPGAENSLPGTPQTAKTSAEKSMMANNSQRKTAKNKKISVFPQPVQPHRPRIVGGFPDGLQNPNDLRAVGDASRPPLLPDRLPGCRRTV